MLEMRKEASVFKVPQDQIRERLTHSKLQSVQGHKAMMLC